MAILRPALYRRLMQCFGHVRVVCEGQPYVPGKSDPGSTKPRTDHWGETYITRCPFCGGDDKLYINHLWHYFDKETDSQRLWMVKCQRRDCLSTYERRCQLSVLVFETVSLGGGPDVLLPGKPKAKLPPELPGELIPVHRLPEDHVAAKYLRDRSFDLVELSRDRSVSFCKRALYRFPYAENRLVIPAYFKGKLAGWQARLLLPPPPDRKKVAKYMTMPGMVKSDVLYGYDLAVRHNFVVLCEGPTDCWRFGPEAVALFGKTLSYRQRELIADPERAWHRGCVVVLLDSDARAESDRIAMDLKDRVANVLRVDLPRGFDPADYSRCRLRRDVFRLARKQGLDLQAMESRDALVAEAGGGTQ